MEWEQSDDTQEPVKVMVKDISCLMEDYLYTVGDKNLKKIDLNLYFYHEHLFATVFMEHCNKPGTTRLFKFMIKYMKININNYHPDYMTYNRTERILYYYGMNTCTLKMGTSIEAK